MNHSPNPENRPAVEAEEEMALAFLAQFRAFERALMKAGFRKAGFSHQQGLPDWEGFARHIERTFQPQGSPVVQAAVAYLLGISVRRLDDRELLQMVPSDRRFYESDSLWLAMVIRAAGRRLSSGLSRVSGRDCALEIHSACFMVLQAWAECEPAVGELLRKA
jgi:hypothetical protein